MVPMVANVTAAKIGVTPTKSADDVVQLVPVTVAGHECLPWQLVLAPSDSDGEVF
jgi:hypothetical protein